MKRVINVFSLLTLVLLLQGFGLVQATNEDQIFQTKPYLQSPMNNGITVMWTTKVPTYSWVEYGVDKSHLQKQQLVVNGIVAAYNKIHKFRLENLIPGKRYYYRVCSREIKDYHAYSKSFGETAVSEVYSFVLPSANTKNFTAVIFNDLHDNTTIIDKVTDIAKNIPHDLTIFNGDCMADVHDADQGIKLISYMNDRVDASNTPVMYIRGNHETRDIFALLMPQYIDYVGGKTYGAFNWGDTRFVVYDCGEDKPDTTYVYYNLNDFSKMRNDEKTFLTKEVASKAFKMASKRVLIGHVPLFGSADDYHPCRELWNPIIKHAPFNISINAHVHSFEYLPRDAFHSFPVVIGGGPSTNIKSNGAATVMVLQKTGAKMTLKVIRIDGKEILNLDL